MEVLRAVVIEGQPLVRAGIASVLRDERVAVVAEAASAGEAAVLLRGAGAHLLVLGGGDRLAAVASAIRRVKGSGDGVRVVALVPRCSREDLLAVLDAGADAVVPHDAGRDDLVAALEAARQGVRHLAAPLTAVLFPRACDGATATATVDGDDVLTPREISVVRLLVGGRSNDQIAGDLFISPSTVKTHLSHVYGKLGVRNRYEAVLKATQLGIL